MKFEDLKVGMEVLVLRFGKRSDLANVEAATGTVLSAERWDKARVTIGSVANRSLAGPDGNKIALFGRIAPSGRYVPVLLAGNYPELVVPSRILGPVETWQPKIDAARRERDTYQRERNERRIRQQALAKQVSERCVGLEQRIKSAGIAAAVMSGGGARVNIVLEDLATAERVVDLLTTVVGRSEVLAAEMHAALDRYRATGEMGEFLVAQKRYNDEERRLRRALYELTGEHYQPTSGRHC